MKRMLLLLVTAATAALTSMASAQDWLTNYDQAAKQAKAENKQILMDFTGSDWCGWCMKLDREVFTQQEFKDYAAKNLVLLKLDFPRKKEQSAEEKKQNEKLAAKYHIEGYPTIIVLNPSGSTAGKPLGYMEGGPSAFISALKKETPKK